MSRERVKDTFRELRKGNRLLENDELASAISHYNAAIKANRKDEVAWNNKGAVLLSLNRLKEALSCFDRALELSPEYSDAWCNRGLVLMQMGEYEEAELALKKALKAAKENEVAWNALGTLHVRKREFNEAKSCYLRALQIDPEYYSVLNNLARTCEEEGDCRKAIEYYNRFLAHNNVFAEAWYHKGLCQMELGLPSKALHSLERAINLEPHMKEALKARKKAKKLLEKGRGKHD